MTLHLEVKAVSSFTDDDEKELIDLVARIFPTESSLEGKWYFDTRPSLVIEAREGFALLGFRIVVERAVEVGGRVVRVGGIGIGVDPAHQRRGLGTVLTRRTLHELTLRGFDVALAFLFNDNPKRLLVAHGFRALACPVSFTVNGARVVEKSPAYARNVGIHCRSARGGAIDDVITAVERSGELHLGSGTW